MRAHHSDLIPESATPGIIRTGARVRVSEPDQFFLRGAFLGIGEDARSERLVAFVQIGSGVQAFPLATTSLERDPDD